MGYSSAMGFCSGETLAQALEEERKKSESYTNTLNNRLKLSLISSSSTLARMAS